MHSWKIIYVKKYVDALPIPEEYKNENLKLYSLNVSISEIAVLEDKMLNQTNSVVMTS